MSLSLSPMQLATLLCAVSAGVGSGMMYVFSTGVMQGLGQLPQEESVRAMQAINVAVINPWFLGVFMGTGLFAGVLGAANALGYAGPVDPWLLAGAGLYIVGVVMVTIGGNVPLNDALAAVDPASLSPATWAEYATPWLRWNHLRSLAAAISSALLVVSTIR